MHTNIIQSYIEKLHVSKPIFELTLSTDADGVRCTQSKIHVYQPDIDANDPISVMVAHCRTESFHTTEGRYRLNKEATENGVIDQIVRGFVDFLSRNLPNKEPRATKIHKWTRTRLRYKTQAHDHCVMLYRYMRQHTDESMGLLSSSNKGHASNIIALLEAMKEKYGA